RDGSTRPRWAAREECARLANTCRIVRSRPRTSADEFQRRCSFSRNLRLSRQKARESAHMAHERAAAPSISDADAGARRITFDAALVGGTQEDERIIGKVLDRYRNDVARSAQTRCRISNLPLALRVARAEPAVDEDETGAAVVRLCDHQGARDTIDVDHARMR